MLQRFLQSLYLLKIGLHCCLACSNCHVQGCLNAVEMHIEEIYEKKNLSLIIHVNKICNKQNSNKTCAQDLFIFT